MGILEKLRPQPRWKHADPSRPRGGGLRLGPDEADVLRALAREDAEARVRRAAVLAARRPGGAGRRARGPIPTRTCAPRRCGSWPASPPRRDEASRAIDVARQLVEAGRIKEVVRRRARERASPACARRWSTLLDEPKALGSVSRHATRRRRPACARSRGCPTPRSCWPSRSSRSTPTSRWRRSDASRQRRRWRPWRSARATRWRCARRGARQARQIEDAVAPPPAAPAQRMSAEDRAARAPPCCVEAEALVAVADPAEAETCARRRARSNGRSCGPTPSVEPALTQQFEAASEAAREAMAERQQERAAEEERRRAARGSRPIASRVCEEIEELDGAEAPGPHRRAEGAVGLRCRRFRPSIARVADAPIPGRLPRVRGARAAPRPGCRPRPRGSRRWRRELEQLVASEQPLAGGPARWREAAPRRRRAARARPTPTRRPPSGWRRPSPCSRRKEHEHQQVRAKQEQDNLRRLQQLCRQVETLAASEQLTLKAGDRALSRHPGGARGQRCRCRPRRIARRCTRGSTAARTLLGPRVQELRDADEWQRWANLQVQEELAKQMEALRPRRTSRPRRARCASCRGAGSTWRWRRARRARRCGAGSRRRRTRCSHARRRYMAAQHAAAPRTWQKKQALCERAEAMSGVVRLGEDRGRSCRRCRREWKTIGAGVAAAARRRSGSGSAPRAIGFFSRRQEDLKKRKDEWSGNLARKEALCAQAEALAAVDRLGRRRGAVQEAAGRVEEHRAGAPVEIGGRLAALPHRL